MITFGSVCSGIEAASVAWEALGWKAVWVAEVDRAASEVLAHRFPDTPNLGDMTTIAARVRARDVPAPDILVGGTPCQSFSVAGLRGGLSDTRGQLTIAFIDLANAIDEIRAQDGFPPVIVVWENVPGVLNHADSPLGCFLAGLGGDDDVVEPGPRPEPTRSSAYWTWDKKTGQHRAKWPDAGCIAGPQRAAAWRIHDAQYHGLAQRRRRVFLVASARQGFDPAAVLLEFDGVRRDSAPRREAGQGVTHPTSPCLTSSGRGVERTGDTRGQDPVVAVIDYGDCGSRLPQPSGSVERTAGETRSGVRERIRSAAGLDTVGAERGELGFGKVVGEPVAHLPPVPTWWDGREVSQTLDAVLHKGQTMPEKNRFPAVLQPVRGFDTYNQTDTGDLSQTLCSRGDSPGGNAHLVPAVLQPVTSFHSKDYGADAADDLAPTLRASGHADSHANGGRTPAVAYAIQERATAENPSSGPGGLGVRSDDAAYTLEARPVTQAVAYAEPLAFVQNSRDEVRLMGGDGQIVGALSAEPGMKQQCNIAASSPEDVVCVTGSVTHTLKAEGFDASEDGTGRGQPIVCHGTQDPCVSEAGLAFTMGRNNGGENVVLADDAAYAFKAGQGAKAQGIGWEKEVAPTLSASESGTQRSPGLLHKMAVRRLMPVECERLQGFPDNWTLVPTGPKRKPAADGPRYKQLGNSMPVPVMSWIGTRIDQMLRSLIGHNGGPPLDFDALLGGGVVPDFEDLLG